MPGIFYLVDDRIEESVHAIISYCCSRGSGVERALTGVRGYTVVNPYGRVLESNGPLGEFTTVVRGSVGERTPRTDPEGVRP